jgi:hypothetical protein
MTFSLIGLSSLKPANHFADSLQFQFGLQFRLFQNMSGSEFGIRFAALAFRERFVSGTYFAAGVFETTA